MNLQNKFLGSEANFFAEIIVNYRLLCNFAQSNVPLFLREGAIKKTFLSCLKKLSKSLESI